MDTTGCDIVKIMSLVVATLAFIVTINQFFVNRQHIRMNIYYKVIERLENIRDQRHEVYSLENINFKLWTIQNCTAVEKVCREFDIVGIIYNQKLIPKRLIKRFYSYPITKCWQICSAYIENIRSQRNQPGHMQQFQNLAEKCKNWR
jgi:hypothetical protein